RARWIHSRLMSVPMTCVDRFASKRVVVPHSQPSSSTESWLVMRRSIVARYSFTPRVATRSVLLLNLPSLATADKPQMWEVVVEQRAKARSVKSTISEETRIGGAARKLEAFGGDGRGVAMPTS